jgi:hypothetical protein
MVKKFKFRPKSFIMFEMLELAPHFVKIRRVHYFIIIKFTFFPF